MTHNADAEDVLDRARELTLQVIKISDTAFNEHPATCICDPCLFEFRGKLKAVQGLTGYMTLIMDAERGTL